MASYSARRRLAGLTFLSAFAERVLGGLQASSAGLGLGVAGIAPLVPALGAAGVLALSHGHGATGRAHAGSQGRAAARPSHERRPAVSHATLAPLVPSASPRRRAYPPRVATAPLAAGPLTSEGGSVDPSQPPATPAITDAAGSAATTTQETLGGHVQGPSSAPIPPLSPVSVTTSPVTSPPVSVQPVGSPTPASTVPTGTPAVSVPSKDVTVSTPAVTVTVTTPTVELAKVTLP